MSSNMFLRKICEYCDNESVARTGEINQSFTANTNGNYAVIINDGTCIQTSSCYNITTVGINDISNSDISLMPNPVNDVLQIKGNKQIQTILIMDNLGKIINVYSVNNTGYKIDMSALKTGIYFVKIETNNSVYIDKVIKQ